jgi:hypothetical protein
MVCAGFTSERDEAEITELSPLCVEGRVIYAAAFDPALERRLLPAAPNAGSAVVSSRPELPEKAPADPADKRLFFLGIAAGVIAALALGTHGSQS